MAGAPVLPVGVCTRAATDFPSGLGLIFKRGGCRSCRRCCCFFASSATSISAKISAKMASRPCFRSPACAFSLADPQAVARRRTSSRKCVARGASLLSAWEAAAEKSIFQTVIQRLQNRPTSNLHRRWRQPNLLVRAMDSSLGGQASDDYGPPPVFPRLGVRDPFKLLGVSREASDEEIQEARSYLASQYAGHERSREAIEAAYDKIIMESFRDRRKSKVNLKSSLKKKVAEAPPWIRVLTNRIETPTSQVILQRATDHVAAIERGDIDGRPATHRALKTKVQEKSSGWEGFEAPECSDGALDGERDGRNWRQEQHGDDESHTPGSPAILYSIAPMAVYPLIAEGVGYSQASYYTSLGLFVISVPGIWSLVKRSTKSKIVRKTFAIPGPKESDGKPLSQIAGEITSSLTRNNFAISERGETVTFEGTMVPSRGQAAFLSFCTAVSLGCVALVLSITAPDVGQNWYYLTVFSPLAGFYYWTRASRKEQIKVKMVVADDEASTDVIIQGDDEQIDRLRRELGFMEKGMVYVKGLLER